MWIGIYQEISNVHFEILTTIPWQQKFWKFQQKTIAFHVTYWTTNNIISVYISCHTQLHSSSSLVDLPLIDDTILMRSWRHIWRWGLLRLGRRWGRHCDIVRHTLGTHTGCSISAIRSFCCKRRSSVTMCKKKLVVIYHVITIPLSHQRMPSIQIFSLYSFESRLPSPSI